MRRKDREVTDLGKIKAIFASITAGHLAMNDHGVPYGVTLNFGFTEEDGVFILYFHSAIQGRKAEIMRDHPEVYFFAETQGRYLEYLNSSGFTQMTTIYDSIAGTGVIHRVEDFEEKKYALAILIRRFSETGIETVSNALLQNTAVWKLILQKVTAKSNPGNTTDLNECK